MTSKKRRSKAEDPRPDEERVDAPVEVPIDEPGNEGSEPRPLETVEDRRVAELEERLKRVQAEFLNETKRIARQADEGRKFAVEGLVRDLIPVFDALHSAVQTLPASAAASGAEAESEGIEDAAARVMREGLDLVERELRNVLGRHGVTRIEAEHSPFDPSQHEALFVVDDDSLPPNTVAHVLRPGFALHGRIVRAAHVSVTRPRPPVDDESSAVSPDAAPPEAGPLDTGSAEMGPDETDAGDEA